MRLILYVAVLHDLQLLFYTQNNTVNNCFDVYSI